MGEYDFKNFFENPMHIHSLSTLAMGLTAESRIMNISNHTVDDYIEKLMGILGCSSSKELIALFHDQP